MSIAINCGYARVAIRDFAQRHKSTCGKLPTASTAGSQVIDDYDQHFRNYPNLQVPHSVVRQKVASSREAKALSPSFFTKFVGFSR